MGCGCGGTGKPGTGGATWKVQMPGPELKIKSYAMEITARAVQAKTPGSTLIPPTSGS